MKVFLTGATGYVGSVVAEKLKGRGYKVVGLARSDEAENKLGEARIEAVRGSLADFDVLKTTAAEADAVIHTAFSHNFDDYDDAVDLDREIIKNLAEILARTNKPLIITSSSAILGDTRGNLADEDYPFGSDSSRRLRGEAENDALQLSSKGIRSIVLRLPLFVYGRGGSSFVPFIINQAKKEGSANFVGAGENRVSAVHVEDAAQAYLSALETSTGKGIYNVSAESVMMAEICEAVGNLLNLKAKSISNEKGREQFDKMFEWLSINNQLDANKIKSQLQWSPNSYRSILEDIENGSYRTSQN
jgi:nucleoside-diphosphate-sugar epimerase